MNAAKAAELAARLDRLPASRALWTIVVLISFAMLVGIGTISLFGPATKGLALEQLSASAAE
jgi:hypothetical protein